MFCMDSVTVTTPQPRLLRPQTLALIADLQAALGTKVSTASAVRHQHGHDESYHPTIPPDVVVFAESVADVKSCVHVCRAHGAPIIPFGGGTSLEGQVLASEGGVSIDLSRMDRILRVNAESLSVTVEPGVRRKQLNSFLRDTGLFFPIDPGADATVGGMTATRASGTNAVRYGTMRDNVVCLEVVLADGREIRTARRAKKSAAGYDLTALFIGSEGTLGIITEITLRLHAIPETSTAAVVGFTSVKSAIDTVIVAIQSGLALARIEFLDDRMMQAINSNSGETFPVQPTLFVEFSGSARQVTAEVETFISLVNDAGGTTIRQASSDSERAALWEVRHSALYAVKALAPGHQTLTTDVCVPINRLADCVLETRADLDRSRLRSAIVGHVGDGNFHTIILVDPDSPDDIATAEQLHETMARRAIGMDGTCTGEHGIGWGKRALLREELGEAVDIMRSLKSTLDPNNLMNPGKIFL